MRTHGQTETRKKLRWMVDVTFKSEVREQVSYKTAPPSACNKKLWQSGCLLSQIQIYLVISAVSIVPLLFTCHICFVLFVL